MAEPDRNPQAKEMADESMVRNLAAQAEAIWPQEGPIFRRHSLPAAPAILDVGCGTGEITLRLAAEFPAATLIGVDLIEPHLELARERARAAGVADRVTFVQGDAFELGFRPGTFDLVVCRHMLQAVPTPERVVAEMVRVARRGATLHVLAEDYDMIHAAPVAPDVARFWFEAPRALGAATTTDLHIGRGIHAHLRKLPLDDLRVDYVIVDTLRVARPTFAAIFAAWRDGYSETTAAHLGWTVDAARAKFDATIACILDPDGYAVWMIPVWTARVR